MDDAVEKRSLLRGRKHARRKAVQALYQWHMNALMGEEPPTDHFVNDFLSYQDMGNADNDYFCELVKGALKHRRRIDSLLADQMIRDTEQVDAVELAILQLATYELIDRIDVPFRVAINEAVELAKTYGADQGHKFVNGILDKLAQDLRAVERQAGRAPSHEPK